MGAILDLIAQVLSASWWILLESAPFMLLGFFVAGVLKAFLPQDFVAKHLGGNGIKNVVKASALGIPIPLCSCGVLPAAAGLKEQSAGKGAVTSFLVSTPETGVDSIAVTYALLDPLMTVIRPVVSFYTALAAGIAVTFAEGKGKGRESSGLLSSPPASSCGSSCCGEQRVKKKGSMLEKFKGGMVFAFNDLLQDIGKWFLFGIVLAGVIAVFVSPEMLDRYLENEYLSLVAMLAVATPLYVCATASTPIAAALALKGISPGAALVFLLAGPATNAAALAVIAKILGKKATAVYVFVILVISFLSGLLVNYLYHLLGFDIGSWIQRSGGEDGGVVAVGCAIILLVLIARTFATSSKKLR